MEVGVTLATLGWAAYQVLTGQHLPSLISINSTPRMVQALLAVLGVRAFGS